MKKPLVGEPVSFSGYFSGSPSGHVLGLLGGFIWGLGMVFNLVAASFTGVAISYAIANRLRWLQRCGRAGLERVQRFGSRAKIFLVFMFVFYALAILLVPMPTIGFSPDLARPRGCLWKHGSTSISGSNRDCRSHDHFIGSISATSRSSGALAQTHRQPGARQPSSCY